MLIFDEATSALDKTNEAEVQRAIDQMKKELGEVTTIVIAHRLSTVRNADRIIVLKKGKIAEDGDHETLLQNYPSGIYAKMVSQSNQAQQQEDKVKTPLEEVPELALIQPTLAKAASGAESRIVKTENLKEHDPVAIQMMQKADESRTQYLHNVRIAMSNVLDPKK